MLASAAVPEWIRPLDDGRLRLVGQRCRACGTHAFPRTSRCKRCSSPALDQALLGPTATLYSLTVDRASPSEADHAMVGQVHFDEGAYVQGYVAGDKGAPPRIGAPMEVVRYEFKPFDDGKLVATYGFRRMSQAMREVVVAGVGMARFGRYKDKTFIDHGVEAVQAALADAGLQWPDMGDAYCGACGIGEFVGNQIGQQLGLTGVPIVNVDNASASGSSAFRLAYHAVAEGRCEVAMAMGTGQIGRRMTNPLGRDEMLKMLAGGQTNAMTIFALVAQRRMQRYGTPAEVFGRIAVKSHWFAARNPYAQYQKETTLEEVMAGRMIADPLTLQMCCPSGDGGAAAVLTTPQRARQLGRHPLVRVRGLVMKGEFWGDSPWTMDLLTASAAKEAYDKAGVGPEDFDLVQLHDATANEELEYYEALGLCPPGEGDRLVIDGDVGPGGRVPVNTDGGLISRGHPLGPTGIAQVWETTMQLRGEAGGRQVADARLGLIQMIGAGAVCFVTILERMP